MGIFTAIISWMNRVAVKNVVNKNVLTTAFNEAIQSADMNGDGEINVKEFSKLLVLIVTKCRTK